MSNDLDKAILKLKRTLEKKASRDMKPLLKAYQDSLKNVQGELSQLANKYIEEGKLSISDAERHSILHKLEKTIVEQANNIGDIELEATTNILKDSYKNAYYQTFYEIDKGIDISKSF